MLNLGALEIVQEKRNDSLQIVFQQNFIFIVL